MERDAVLFANEAFYRAFAARDVAAMDSVWARHLPVACVHPGWGRLNGREPVMESWRSILENPGAPAITCRDAAPYMLGEVAFVVCYEVIGNTYLIATNVFAREGGTWHMVHHQAGPTTGVPEPAGDEETPGQLH
jgi:hypothetical protein